MVADEDLYRSWIVNGSYLNKMLHCGGRANSWLEHAIVECLPRDILESWCERLAFVSTANSDAFRIAKKTREERELIFISERIIPAANVAEDHPDVRYLMFVALHEIVHAIKQHKPPNEISPDQNAAQEAEADNLAFDWFNAYVGRKNNPHLPALTRNEVAAAMQRNAAKMQGLQ